MIRNKKYIKSIVDYLKTKVTKAGVLEITVDIESCHNDMKVYSTGKQYVGHTQIVRERNIIMIQLGHISARQPKDVFTLEWDWHPTSERRDENLLEEFIYILNQFNDVIVHTKNGTRFDKPYINGRLFLMQLDALPPFEHKDVEKVVRGAMYLNSYALDYLSKALGHGGKVKMDRDVWIDIEEHNCEKAMNKMRRYGKKDILDTNKLVRVAYKYVPELRTYTTIKQSGNTCHHCASIGVHSVLTKRGFSRALSGKKQKWVCDNKRHPADKNRFFVESRIQKYD